MVGAAACNSVLGLDYKVGVKCGDGTELVDGTCQTVAAPDAKAPQFAGLASISVVSPTSLRLDWAPAVSSTAKAADLRYRVFVAKTSKGQDFHAPTTIVTGATTTTLTGLTEGATYYVVVRAADAAGHEEGNTYELAAKAQADKVASAFGGVTSAAPGTGDGTVKLTWAPATDDLSAPVSITYLVYGGLTPPVTDAEPIATVTGDTSVQVTVEKPETPYHFVVRAKDAAGNVDANTREAVSKAAHDATPPLFGGCAKAVGVASNQVEVSYSAGSDDVTPPADLAYDVYAFTDPGPHADLGAAVSKAWVRGDLKVTVGNLAADTTYYFFCQARDLSGNVGGNPVDVKGTTEKDTLPPDFKGATSAKPTSADSFQVRLEWPPASDVQTAPEKLAYDVYTASKPGAQDFGAPPTLTVTGQTWAELLAPPGATTYFVVRARDEAGNVSKDVVEVSAATRVNFDCQIQPVFDKSCVPGCHTLGQKQYNPILASPVSYTFIVADGVVQKKNPEGSWLYQDLVCVPQCNGVPGCVQCDLKLPSGNTPHFMPQPPVPPNAPNPAPTADEIALVYKWIAEGADGPLSPWPGAPPGYSVDPATGACELQ